jgi:hypothetical protein
VLLPRAVFFWFKTPKFLEGGENNTDWWDYDNSRRVWGIKNITHTHTVV